MPSRVRNTDDVYVEQATTSTAIAAVSGKTDNSRQRTLGVCLGTACFMG